MSSPSPAIVAARALALAALVAACGEERESPASTDGPTWDDGVATLVGDRCAGCHAGPDPAGAYDPTSYLGALGGGSDAVPNAIAGDPGSRILTALEDPAHRSVADAAPALRAWVVDGRLALRRSRIHGPGILDPRAADFHGEILRTGGWRFAACQGCHGDDFDGGTSGAACTTCHAPAPTACETCHGDGPTTGSHAAHRAAPELGRPTGCEACHRVPERWDQPGHILDENGRPDPSPSEVVLGALAARDVSPPRRTAPPAFEPATGTCSDVYCHGGTLGDGAAAHPAPTWYGPSGQAACGGCHGAPPTDHAQTTCNGCHPAPRPGDRVAAGHLDGVLDVGAGCTDCHGSAAGGPAPPRSLDGATAPSALAVGAHQSHLRAAGRVSAPIACQECHVVPASVTAPGHIDSERPAEVFPAGSGTLARADGAVPTWDRGTATCSDVYCHGGGAGLATDDAPGRVAVPTWTRVGRGEAACGRCHGLPPRDTVHAPTLGIADCTTCHPSVDAFGNVLFTGPAGAETTEHLDGTVDLR
jgi:predicted CxxxxCH...CXXCH cytochrome family protein